MLNGNHLLDLGKMKYEANISDVLIVRPFLKINKLNIYDIASKYKIPFFKDTTPEWSNRGAIRNNIFPSIEARYPTPFISSFFVKPSVTPVTILFIIVLAIPQEALATLLSFFGITLTLSCQFST